MKKYKVSFFAVLMTLSTTMAFAGVPPISNNTANSNTVNNNNNNNNNNITVILNDHVGSNSTPSNTAGNKPSSAITALATSNNTLQQGPSSSTAAPNSTNISEPNVSNTTSHGASSEAQTINSNTTTGDPSIYSKPTSSSNTDHTLTPGVTGPTSTSSETDDIDTSAIEDKRDNAHNILSGVSTAATGIGGMEMAQAISEKKADAAAEDDMKAYISTFKCDYGKSQKYDYSTQDIILPGGNELVQYYTEYKTLADQLKADKTALGLTPGIESQVVYDKAESGLYKNAATGNTGGKYTSLSRALLDENSEDAAEWAEQKDKTKKRLIIGASVAAAGLVVGFVGDKLVDKHYDKLEEQELTTKNMFEYIRETIGEEEYDKMMEEYLKQQGGNP